MTAPNDVATLVERGAKAIYEARGLDKATGRAWSEATSGDQHYCRLYATAALEGAAATIAALQAEVERAKEDERDRLLAVLDDRPGSCTEIAREWLRDEGAMILASRSASRKENTP